MKLRNGFVSNSSSSSFIIWNNSDKSKKIIDFVLELKDQILLYENEDFTDLNLSKNPGLAFQAGEFFGNIVSDAFKDTTIIEKGKNILTFGDEDGTTLGRVFDYMLRSGGSSDSFNWEFYEYNR